MILHDCQIGSEAGWYDDMKCELLAEQNPALIPVMADPPPVAAFPVAARAGRRCQANASPRKKPPFTRGYGGESVRDRLRSICR